MRPVQLRCEQREDVPCIDTPAPRLSWALEGGERQTAYRVLRGRSVGQRQGLLGPVDRRGLRRPGAAGRERVRLDRPGLGRGRRALRAERARAVPDRPSRVARAVDRARPRPRPGDGRPRERRRAGQAAAAAAQLPVPAAAVRGDGPGAPRDALRDRPRSAGDGAQRHARRRRPPRARLDRLPHPDRVRRARRQRAPARRRERARRHPRAWLVRRLRRHEPPAAGPPLRRGSGAAVRAARRARGRQRRGDRQRRALASHHRPARVLGPADGRALRRAPGAR